MLIELAGIPAEVNCQYPENESFFRDYLTDRAPLFTVAPGEIDRNRIQAEFDRMDEAGGLPKLRRTDEFLENNAVHALLVEKLAEYGVLLMHGSALCMDGEAYIFSAKSGTGKSTHTRLWREVFRDRVWMINDDKPLLRITREGVWVYGSPWNGKHHLSRNASAPLKAIVELNRGTENRIEPLACADAFQMLASHCYFSDQPWMKRRVVSLEMEIMEQAQFFRLFCDMRPEAALTAWRGMQGGISREERVCQ